MSLKVNRNMNRNKLNITILILVFMIFLIAFFNLHYLILMNRDETLVHSLNNTVNSTIKSRSILKLNKNSSFDKLKRIINKLNSNNVNNNNDLNLVDIEQQLEYIKYECRSDFGSKYEYFLTYPWSWTVTLLFAIIPVISNTVSFI